MQVRDEGAARVLVMSLCPRVEGVRPALSYLEGIQCV